MGAIVGVTLEEAEAMARSIPRTRFTYSVKTSGSSSGGFSPMTIQVLKDAIGDRPLNTGFGSNGVYIFPVFAAVKDNE